MQNDHLKTFRDMGFFFLFQQSAFVKDNSRYLQNSNTIFNLGQTLVHSKYIHSNLWNYSYTGEILELPGVVTIHAEGEPRAARCSNYGI